MIQVGKCFHYGEEMDAVLSLGLKMSVLEACIHGLALRTRSLLKFIETRVSRARDLHPHDRNSPDPLSATKPLFFDLRSTLRRSHSKGMEIETKR